MGRLSLTRLLNASCMIAIDVKESAFAATAAIRTSLLYMTLDWRLLGLRVERYYFGWVTKHFEPSVSCRPLSSLYISRVYPRIGATKLLSDWQNL